MLKTLPQIAREHSNLLQDAMMAYALAQEAIGVPRGDAVDNAIGLLLLQAAVMAHATDCGPDDFRAASEHAYSRMAAELMATLNDGSEN